MPRSAAQAWRDAAHTAPSAKSPLPLHSLPATRTAQVNDQNECKSQSPAAATPPGRRWLHRGGGFLQHTRGGSRMRVRARACSRMRVHANSKPSARCRALEIRLAARQLPGSCQRHAGAPACTLARCIRTRQGWPHIVFHFFSWRARQGGEAQEGKGQREVLEGFVPEAATYPFDKCTATSSQWRRPPPRAGGSGGKGGSGARYRAHWPRRTCVL